MLIGESDLTGTWTDRAGDVTLQFAPDHRAAVAAGGLGASCGPEGIWWFHVRDSGTSARTDSRAAEGYGAVVAVYSSVTGPPGPSTVCERFYPSVFRVDGAYVLCLVDDPDSFCSDGGLLRKAPESGDPSNAVPRHPARR
ncbi:hypothetical protein AB0O31_01360 [Kitasatospora cineracea]|uniref:hypothetical protein n=1 Tax=Kitasatospora cineracea TaxID=88074 RepID=UPI00343FA039